MTLDNFGIAKTPKKQKKKEKLKITKKKKKTSLKKQENKETLTNTSYERKKYYLKCSTKCGYRRMIKKKSLNETDYICRKCQQTMKVDKIEE